MDKVKDALMQAMEASFGDDERRINHARRVTEYAEEISKREGGDYPIIVAAGVLHDIGIHEAERKHGSTSGKYQEIEGPPIAREILARLSFEPGQVDEICDIIAHHHSPGKVTTKNFSILYDADWLVNLRDDYDIKDTAKLASVVDKVFLTATGKAMAKAIYLDQ
ncbi:MAG: HD domain-containing protein [Chloroflexi bacterium]|nr:HD domain-containing protein [Chloroflexota bacterium]